MFTLLLESPIAVGGLGAVGAVLAIAFGKLTGSKRTGRVRVGIAVATLVLLAVERVVMTDHEQIKATLEQMVADLERNDLQAVLGHIHSSVPDVRSQAEIIVPAFWFERVDIKRLHKIRLEGQGTARRAVAEFNVMVTGRDRDGTVESGSIPRFVILVLKPDADTWRVIGIQDHDPQQGFLRRTS